MKVLTVMLSFFLCFAVAHAQDKDLAFVRKMKPENRINFSYAPQWYLNKGGVHNDGNIPDVISAKNTQGYVLGLSYERITRYGLIIEAGLHYGRQNHNVDITYSDLTFFDTINQERLAVTDAYSNYKGNVGYIGWRYMMGCQWQIGKTFLKGCKLEAKAGIACRISVTEKYEDAMWRIGYERNDTIYIATFGNDYVDFGKASTLNGDFVLSYNAELYLGLKKELALSFLKNFSFGLLVTHSGFGKDWGGVANVQADTKNFSGKVISQDYYRSRDFSFGLKMAVGLWK